MKSINDLIQNISAGESASHAYIIEGRAGAARDRFAVELASGLECTAEDAGSRPCGICDACRQVAAGTSPDVVRMEMSGKSGYKTEDAAGFMERLSMRAYGRQLIGIIDSAENLSEIVQNKLLKTLEEPKDDVVVLLLTDSADRLLATVKSRCSVIRMEDYEGIGASGDREDQGEADEAMTTEASRIAECLGGGPGKHGSDSEFYKFREFIDKNIDSAGDALRFIAMTEEKLRDKMVAGGDAAMYAEHIEAAERASTDIRKGMDRFRALKRMYLEICT